MCGMNMRLGSIKLNTIKFMTALFALIVSLGVFADVYVEGYTRSDGTEVSAHYRSDPNDTVTDNWSYVGNTNPYTGEVGTNRYEESPTSEFYIPRNKTYASSNSDSSSGFALIFIIALVAVIVGYTFSNSSNPQLEQKRNRRQRNPSQQYETRVINENEFDSYPDEVRLIQLAIEKGRLVEFLYQKSGSSRAEKRVIKPTNYVAFKNLCVQGICQTKNEERNFALTNITNLKVIDAP